MLDVRGIRSSLSLHIPHRARFNDFGMQYADDLHSSMDAQQA
jgi:hypothetical protein